LSLYNWSRFWCPIEGKIFLSDAGFLYYPDTAYGKIYNPDLIELNNIQESSCLILLGESGTGKSTELQLYIENITPKITAQRDEILFLNLNIISDATDLRQELFENSVFRRWEQGTNKLYLFLDSFDECILRLDTLANKLIEKLKIYKKERLYLCIACRPAIWTKGYQSLFKQIWQDIITLELAPLRIMDVNEAAEKNGINVKTFEEEVLKAGVVSFATKPMTLNFLIDQFKHNGKLSSNQYDLFYNGCKYLCTETNPFRAASFDPRIQGTLSSEQKMLIAARIATCLVCSNKYSVWNNDYLITNISDHAIKQEDLTILEENVNGQPLIITKQNLLETIQTALFTDYTSYCMRFVHKSYAEFLAAWYLAYNDVSIDKIISLISVNCLDKTKIIPQLYEVAAWLANMRQDIFDKIFEIDPEVLIVSDIKYNSGKNKEKLVTKLMELQKNGDLSSDYLALRKNLAKLNHTNLLIQINKYLNDPDLEIKDLTIDIIEYCKLESFQDQLLEIAMNDSLPIKTRKNAVYALKAVANSKTKQKLSEKFNPDLFRDDIQDELKGSILSLLWPEYINAEQLFEVLTKQKDSHLIGSYNAFITYELVNGLNKESLTIALNWIGDIEGRLYQQSYTLQGLFKDIYSKAWDNLDDPKILRIFAKTIYERLKKDYWNLLDCDSNKSFHKAFYEGQNKRRNIIEIILFNLISTDDEIRTFIRCSNVVIIEDIPWLTKLYLEESNTLKKGKIAKALEHFHKNYIINKDNQDIEKIFTDFNQQEELVDKFGKFNVTYQEDREIKSEKVLLNPPPSYYLNKALDRIESGETSAWADVTAFIKLEPDDKLPAINGDIINYNKLYGWINSDAKTKKRIIKAAKKYLLEHKKDYSYLLNVGSWQSTDYLGYDALFLLFNEDYNFVNNLSSDIWNNWADMVFSYHGSSYDTEQNAYKQILALAYKKIPDKFNSILSLTIDHYNSDNNQHFYILDKFDHCYSNKLAYFLLEKAKRDTLMPELKKTIIEYLILRDFAPAKSYALNVVKDLPAIPTEEESKVTTQIALSLVNKLDEEAWLTIWSKIEENQEFGKDILLSIGEKLNIATLSEISLGKLYIFLEKNFPSIEDRLISGRVTARDNVTHLRSTIFVYLINIGAINALESIAIGLPEIAKQSWFKHNIALTKVNLCKLQWNPPSTRDIIEVVLSDKQLITSSDYLFNLVLRALKRIEINFHSETPAVERIWNEFKVGHKKIFTPKDENAFSDELKRSLEEELKGVIVSREVEIRKTISSDQHTGQNIDIRIDVLNDQGRFSVIIEVKGCWNSSLSESIKTQLTDRYLADNADCRHGIYLIGWFLCKSWDEKNKKNRMPSSFNFNSIEEAQNYFEEKAKELSNGVQIRAFVMDTRIRKDNLLVS